MYMYMYVEINFYDSVFLKINHCLSDQSMAIIIQFLHKHNKIWCCCDIVQSGNENAKNEAVKLGQNTRANAIVRMLFLYMGNV